MENLVFHYCDDLQDKHPHRRAPIEGLIDVVRPLPSTSTLFPFIPWSSPPHHADLGHLSLQLGSRHVLEVVVIAALPAPRVRLHDEVLHVQRSARDPGRVRCLAHRRTELGRGLIPGLLGQNKVLNLFLLEWFWQRWRAQDLAHPFKTTGGDSPWARWPEGVFVGCLRVIDPPMRPRYVFDVQWAQSSKPDWIKRQDLINRVADYFSHQVEWAGKCPKVQTYCALYCYYCCITSRNVFNLLLLN